MDSTRKDFEFECFEKYYGSADEVKTMIEDCPRCGAKMAFSHYPDSGNLVVQETARCLYCDFGQRKLIHQLN